MSQLCMALAHCCATCCTFDPLRLQDGGAVTAGNSSPITDGACALVLLSAAKAAELGCPVLAVLRGYGDANQDPEWFTTAPAAVTPKVLPYVAVLLVGARAFRQHAYVYAAGRAVLIRAMHGYGMSVACTGPL